MSNKYTPDDWLAAQSFIESGHCWGAHRMERASVVALAEAFAEVREEGRREALPLPGTGEESK